MFQQTSYFDYPQAQPVQISVPKLPAKQAAKTREIDHKTLEDWAHRVESAAYEAQDERLLALYSDLLDLRDDIVHLLHTS